MKWCKQSNWATDVFDERELDNFKNCAHREIGIAAALEYCVACGICAPPWLVAAASDLLIDLLKREKATGPGRAVGHLARFQQDQWDLERWDAVLEVRRRRDKVRHELEIYASDPKYGVPPKSVSRLDAWFRKHGTFVCASMSLAGRNARVGWQAIKASYRKVERNLQDSEKATKYYLFSHQFLRKLGLEGPNDRKPGTKTLPIYNLTP